MVSLLLSTHSSALLSYSDSLSLLSSSHCDISSPYSLNWSLCSEIHSFALSVAESKVSARTLLDLRVTLPSLGVKPSSETFISTPSTFVSSETGRYITVPSHLSLSLKVFIKILLSIESGTESTPSFAFDNVTSSTFSSGSR